MSIKVDDFNKEGGRRPELRLTDWEGFEFSVCSEGEYLGLSMEGRGHPVAFDLTFDDAKRLVEVLQLLIEDGEASS